jgi:hypothetical protein
MKHSIIKELDLNMNRSTSQHSDERTKKIKKTKSVDKIKGFSKAI